MKQILAERSISGDPDSANRKRGRSVTVNLAESPLAWLGARKLVSERQLAAGEMLRRDYERAALPQRVTMQWDAPPNGKVARGSQSHGATTLAQIDAKARFDGAIAAAGAGIAVLLQSNLSAQAQLAQLQTGAQESSNQWRTHGLGAQILADLGARKLRVLGKPRKFSGLSGFGLEVVEQVPL